MASAQKWKTKLSDKELEDIINNMSESEDGLDITDAEDNDEEYTPCIESDTDEEADVLQLEPVITEKKFSYRKESITWKKKNLILNSEQLQFRGKEDLPTEISNLESPIDFFNYFFTDELVEKIVSETNLYALQVDPSKPVNYSPTDVRNYLGILLYTSFLRMPNTRFYWSDAMGISEIKHVMPINKFEKLRKFFHINDNSLHKPREHPQHDRLHKIRPLIDTLNIRFRSVPFEQHLSIDEQVCSTKVRHFMKQYQPNKPHKWGFKLFVLSGVSGFAYQFEIFSGQENNISRANGEPDLGAAANVVVRLSRTIPKNIQHKLYFDNYYTTVPLMVYLAENGILALGTVRRNRIPNNKLPDEKMLKKEKRGTSFEYVANINSVDISAIVWKDNKIVTLLSTFAGQQPIDQAKRFDRKLKQNVFIERPFVVKQYNIHMGGVDLLDSIIGRNKIILKSRKWYIRLVYHLLDLTISNAWLLYKRVNMEKGAQSKLLTLAEFRCEVAQCLCKMQSVSLKRGRPSTADIEKQLEIKKHRGPTQHMPPKPVRTDGISHWPLWSEKRIRCKFPNCTGYTVTKCEKCGVGLCFNKINNCFRTFHV